MFGYGKQAYEGTLDDDNLPRRRQRRRHYHDDAHSPAEPDPIVRPVQPAHQVQQPRAPQALPSTSRNRLTSKQLGAIQAIARKRGYDPQGLRGFVKQQFGAQPEFLTQDQASKLFSAMSAQAGNGHDQGQHESGAEG